MSEYGAARTINGCDFVPLLVVNIWREQPERRQVGAIHYLGGGDDSRRVRLYREVINDRYINCGYACWLTGELDPKYMIGDILEWVFRMVGIKALTNIYTRMTGKDCGCRRRQNILNQWNEIVIWKLGHVL